MSSNINLDEIMIMLAQQIVDEQVEGDWPEDEWLQIVDGYKMRIFTSFDDDDSDGQKSYHLAIYPENEDVEKIPAIILSASKDRAGWAVGRRD